MLRDVPRSVSGGAQVALTLLENLCYLKSFHRAESGEPATIPGQPVVHVTTFDGPRPSTVNDICTSNGNWSPLKVVEVGACGGRVSVAHGATTETTISLATGRRVAGVLITDNADGLVQADGELLESPDGRLPGVSTYVFTDAVGTSYCYDRVLADLPADPGTYGAAGVEGPVGGPTGNTLNTPNNDLFYIPIGLGVHTGPTGGKPGATSATPWVPMVGMGSALSSLRDGTGTNSDAGSDGCPCGCGAVNLPMVAIATNDASTALATDFNGSPWDIPGGICFCPGYEGPSLPQVMQDSTGILRDRSQPTVFGDGGIGIGGGGLGGGGGVRSAPSAVVPPSTAVPISPNWSNGALAGGGIRALHEVRFKASTPKAEKVAGRANELYGRMRAAAESIETAERELQSAVGKLEDQKAQLRALAEHNRIAREARVAEARAKGLVTLDDLGQEPARQSAGDGGNGKPPKQPSSPAGGDEEHHVWPSFLGGPDDGMKVSLPGQAHQDLHSDLMRFLETKKDCAGNSMRPSSGNTGRDIQRNFTVQERLQALAEFYKTHAHKYPAAYEAFVKAHPDLR